MAGTTKTTKTAKTAKSARKAAAKTGDAKIVRSAQSNGIVTPANNREPVRFATLGEVEDFAHELPEEFLACREMGHRWLPRTASQNNDGTFHREMRCPRCKTRKQQEISQRGEILATQYKHPEGYLHQGLGRIAGDGRGVLRLESIKRTITRVEANQKD